MRITTALTVGMMLAGLATQAQALDMNKPSVYNYNYVEGGYVMNDDLGGDGFILSGAFDVNRTVGVLLSYETISADDKFFGVGVTTEINVVQLGVGYHHKYDYSSVTPGTFLSNMDLWYKIGVEKSTFSSTISFPGFPDMKAEDSKTGLFLGVQARKEMIQALQLTLQYMYHSGRYIEGASINALTGTPNSVGSGRAFELTVDAMYDLTSSLAGYLNYSVFDDGLIPILGNYAETTIGLRYTF